MGERVEDGGPAFPGDMPTVQLDGNKLPFAPGMSLRDWFAGQALAGILANQHTHGDGRELIAPLANMAFAIADAMLKARSQPKASPHV